MALQSSGQISLQDVQDEFGGSHPISLSEYYGSDTVPASGAISLNDFYGTSAWNPFIATGGTITTSGDYKTHTFTSSGTFNVSQVGTDGTVSVTVVGGGGGGAGSSRYRSNYGGSGGSGGRRINQTVSVSGNVAVTVGAAGMQYESVCGLSNIECGRNHNGNSGGTSSFGSVSATGGGGGTHGYSQTGYGGSAGSPGGSAGTQGQNSTSPWGSVNSWNGYGGAGTSGNNYGCHWACELGYSGEQGVVQVTYKYQ